MNFQNKTAIFASNGKDIKIHALSTGMVSVKSKFRESDKRGLLAKVEVFLDKKFTEWLPIWVWVIEHPEGIFIIDTGVSSNVMSKNYFQSSGAVAKWINTSLFRFKVQKEDEIGAQLERLGINTNGAKVFLTHLHLDHTDGLSYFKESTIFLHEKEWQKPYGNLPKLYPKWFKPVLLKLTDTFEDFDSISLTKSGDLLAIHTPGHSEGHISILLKTDNANILFAGDVCYSQNQIFENKIPGANLSYGKTKETYRKIRVLSEKKKLIILPSHNINAENGLN